MKFPARRGLFSLVLGEYQGKRPLLAGKYEVFFEKDVVMVMPLACHKLGRNLESPMGGEP